MNRYKPTAAKGTVECDYVDNSHPLAEKIAKEIKPSCKEQLDLVKFIDNKGLGYLKVIFYVIIPV
jgi:hypothetical protein